ncbi:MAG: TIGR04053 family radical SAM/SPASM domain-containing protein [Actinobacteria bacterium]|nr:TIGR04053 family radical SAM/SPASM domain-containing protein [Actinomycetota bacterium]
MRRPHIDLSDRPFIVIWEVTRACALACRHCRAQAQPLPAPDELDTEQGLALVDQVADLGRPPPLFVLTGGDPFLRADLPELIRHARARKLPVGVSPSGTPTLTAAELARVRDAGAQTISLSLDGANASTHDAFRGVPGSYDSTVRAWQEAQDLGFKVQINTSVTRSNVSELADIAHQLHTRGALAWSLFFLVPTGRATLDQQLSAQQAEDVLHFAYDLDTILSTKATEAPAFRRVCQQRQRNPGAPPRNTGPTYRLLTERRRQLLPETSETLRRPPLPVNAGNGFIFISHTGEVYPSGFLPIAVGNVTEQPLHEIYRTAELLRDLREPELLQGRCGACGYRDVCGGSRARAYATTGDLFAADPLCPYQPGPELTVSGTA